MSEVRGLMSSSSKAESDLSGVCSVPDAAVVSELMLFVASVASPPLDSDASASLGALFVPLLLPLPTSAVSSSVTANETGEGEINTALFTSFASASASLALIMASGSASKLVKACSSSFFSSASPVIFPLDCASSLANSSHRPFSSSLSASHCIISIASVSFFLRVRFRFFGDLVFLALEGSLSSFFSSSALSCASSPAA
mmetsp:Transcript_30071/g.89363  ORF Transcript_30071/g.89363 Transcript_30071/m.89363 type:complete len:200 (+) Transcript_30071:2168-2767(+)